MSIKVIEIGGTEFTMRASALIPRIYRFKFGRDIVSDLRQLQKKWKKIIDEKLSDEEKEDAQFSALDLTIFENVAWVMAKQGDPNIPDDPGEWLDSIDGIFSIYEVLPKILELWHLSQHTTSVPKKA